MKKIISIIIALFITTNNILYSDIQFSGNIQIRTFDIAKDTQNNVSWYDAKDTSTISLRDDTYVTQWDDKSGLNYDMSQVVEANQPVYDSTGFNNLPTVSFSTIDSLNGTYQDFPKKKYTWFLVGTMNSGDGTQGFFDATTLAATNKGFSLLYDAGATRSRINDGVTLKDAIKTESLPTTYIYEGSFDGTTLTLYLDGVLQDTATPSNPLSNTITLLILGSLNIAGYYLEGDISELLIYDRDLTMTEKTQVRKYLTNKWGL